MHLLVNLAENGHFGCDNHCPFCEWNKLDYGKYWFPSDEELDLAMRTCGSSLTLSGGGDPLYHFEKNQSLIKHFVDYVTSHGRRAGIYTHSLQTLWKYRETFKSWPVFFLLSINRRFTAFEQQVVDYFKDQINIISVVLNDGPDLPPIEEVVKVIQAFSPIHIRFREHWVHSIADRTLLDPYREVFHKYHCGFIASVHYLKVRVMFEGKITTCGAIDKTVLHIEKPI